MRYRPYTNEVKSKSFLRYTKVLTTLMFLFFLFSIQPLQSLEAISSSVGSFGTVVKKLPEKIMGSLNTASTSSGRNGVTFEIVLGRPTDTSVTANIISDTDVELYVEYGIASGSYPLQSVTYPVTAGDPIEFLLGGLPANTRCVYRIVYRTTGATEWTNGEEYSFMTQRPPGESFVFTIQSDSHFGQYGGQTADEVALYEVTIQNVIDDNPDFHIDLGDTFAMDPSPLGTGMTESEADAAYYIQRPYLAPLTHSVPFYFVLGNHENEEGWNFDDTYTPPDQSLAIVGMKYRKLYYPNPIPNDFYTGNTDPLDEPIGGDTNREDYWAWEWGDALFLVIDPFHYSMTWPNDEGTGYGGEGQDGEASGDRWDWSLGIDQYLWFKNVLETSTAKYKFVFSHHVTGGATQYGRGGQLAAPYFEWGGYNIDDTWGWDDERSSIDDRWDVPVHQLMVDNGVDIYFHGHDHIYAYEEVDGIAYVEVAKPDDAGYDWEPYGYGYNEDLYPDAIEILPNSGYMRVSVSPEQVLVEYVRSYLPGDGENGMVAHSFTVPLAEPGSTIGDVNGDEVVNSTDALIILSGDVGMDVTSFCPMNCGDVNKDGFVNSTDALILLSYDVGISVPFPVGETGCPTSVTQPPGCSP